MAKHDRAFAEVITRFFVPMDSELWEQLQDSKLVDLLAKSNNVTIHQPKKRRKGGTENGKK